MQIPITADRMAAALQTAGPLGLAMQNGTVGGDFMALLMQLLEHTETGTAEMPLPFANSWGKDTLTQQQEQNAMEMLAALLMQPDMQDIQEILAVPVQEWQQMQQGNSTAAYLKEQSAAVQQAALQHPEDSAQVKQSGTETLFVTVEENAVQPAEQTARTEALQFSGAFRKAVEQAKKSGVTETDKTTLQAGTVSQASTEQVNQTLQQPLEKAPVKLDVKDMVQTMTKKLPVAIKQGDSSFTMKLKPEGLGEITVKLVQEAGKTAVTILSALPETEKLIGAQLGILQKALEPMDVTVRQEPYTAEMAAQLQADISDQRQEFLLWQQRQHHSSRNWQAAATEVEEILAEQAGPETVLDAYI